MNRNEAETLIRYAMILYPSFRPTEQQLNSTILAWSAEFMDEPKDLVAEAFKIARSESPKWMPSIPEIQSAINSIKMTLRVKSKEQEFKDSHCGKSQSEWADYDKWEKSENGKEKLKAFRSKLMEIVAGGQNE